MGTWVRTIGTWVRVRWVHGYGYDGYIGTGTWVQVHGNRGDGYMYT